nr:mast cell protease 2-like isoform X2 [Plodia interpunctella]XP_053604418.1 mast cell protease 2-like isoform X2 [Plodia interpunctella]
MMSSGAIRLQKKSRLNIPRFRVINGRDAHENEYPFVVSLLMRAKGTEILLRVCTGSAINSEFVLTAAHCLIPGIEIVRCGNMTQPPTDTALKDRIKCKSKILKQIPHPSYVDDNDIALIQIDPLILQQYGRLEAVDYKSLLGRAVKYAGYGYFVYNANDEDTFIEQQHKPLQIGEGVIYDASHNYNTGHRFDSGPLLLIAPKCSNIKQHIYSGDSGGPLFVGGRIAGIAAHVHGRALNFERSVQVMASFTPVSPYLEWILFNVKKNAISSTKRKLRVG